MSAFIVVGGQWGDEGKGLISAFLSVREKAAYTCRAGTGSNAEHGIYLQDKKTYLKTNQLPLGWIFSKDSQIRIGSGVAVNPDLLLQEIGKYKLNDRVLIDYRCPIISKEHIASEQNSKSMQGIGSTFSGTGYCRSDFVLRKAKQARDIEVLKPYITDVTAEINKLSSDSSIIIESSQGTFLSLAVSSDYPNTTSDNVTTNAALDDVGLNWKKLSGVILVVKALPTREGAGGFGNAIDITHRIEGTDLAETSSIQNAMRRKADSIDFALLRYAVEINGATEIALTFCDHYDKTITDCTEKYSITKQIRELINNIEKTTDTPVTILNTGKSYASVIDLVGDTKIPNIDKWYAV